PYVISKIAEIKGTTPDEVERKTRANAFELFTRVNN
ncbi:MAG: hydrolase TatD, partial [Agathobacter sp.]|nr:hydrolase TatD [Agathobacter sp.]